MSYLSICLVIRMLLSKLFFVIAIGTPLALMATLELSPVFQCSLFILVSVHHFVSFHKETKVWGVKIVILIFFESMFFKRFSFL